MKYTCLLAILLTGCLGESGDRLTEKGIIGYDYCLANPDKVLQMGTGDYNCELYLKRFKEAYDNTTKG
jgi:hypothetical protein